MDSIAPFVERPLIEKERSITLWLLQHGNHEASKFLPEVEQATVVGRCRECYTVRLPDPMRLIAMPPQQNGG